MATVVQQNMNNRYGKRKERRTDSGEGGTVVTSLLVYHLTNVSLISLITC